MESTRAAAVCGELLQTHSASRRLLVACWLAVSVRALLVLGVLALPLAWIRADAWEYLYVALLTVFVPIWGIYLALAVTLRCPACGRRLLVESREPKHPSARRARYCDSWGTVVRDVLRSRQCVCMYCGAHCRITHSERCVRRTPV